MKTVTRREIGKFSVLTLLLACVVGPITVLTACSASNVAAAIIASFGQVLRLLQSSGIVTDPTLIAAANAALAAFQAAYTAFQNGTETAEKLAAAAQAAVASIQAFLAATNIGGPIAQVAAALLEIILSTLASFLPAPTFAKPEKFKLAGHLQPIAPVSRTVVQYKSDWNAACVQQGHPELRIK